MANAEDRVGDFTRDKFWWLRQIAVDRPHILATDVALILADHANRSTGEMYPAQETMARILNVSDRTVRACIKTLVDRGHLICNGWKRLPAGGHVKVYRWRLHDRRVAERFDLVALGLVAPGEILPGSHASTRKELARSTRKDFAGSKAHPEDFCRPPGKITSSNRRDSSREPSEEPSEEQDSIETDLFEADDQTAGKKRRRVGNQKATMPDDWPHAEDRAWASAFWMSEHRPDLVGRIDAEAAKARDHHLAKDSRFTDWAAAWRTWCRKALQFSRPAMNGSPARAGESRTVEEAVEKLRGEINSRRQGATIHG